jgi:hypothetical protein
MIIASIGIIGLAALGLLVIMASYIKEQLRNDREAMRSYKLKQILK